MMTNLLRLAGLGQLCLAGGSLAIPAVLGWREDTAKLRVLTRQVFWTYAGYIWAINVSFGLLSAVRPRWLLDGSSLARTIGGFITLYWGARIGIQFLYFDTSEAPAGLQFRVAEAGLVGLFVVLAVIYGAITLGLR